MKNGLSGKIALIGSGETAASGGQVFDALSRHLVAPLHIAVLETPAGFELNAGQVVGRVAAFLQKRLASLRPQVVQVAARKKGTPLSPDSPEVVAPLFQSNMIFCGPGSPTYTVRQLQDSLAWHVLQARHRLGASLALASAATVAAGALALPVYEIFKVGEDPHWKPGLDLLGPYGLALVVVPHWNNRDGGENLDTSCCFIGQERFRLLLDQLSEEMIVVGIDEHTALLLDFETERCTVMGNGSIHLIHKRGSQEDIAGGKEFPLAALGNYHPLESPAVGLPPRVWQQALAVQAARWPAPAAGAVAEVPAQVQELVAAREAARLARDWANADRLRALITALGWQVADLPGGPRLTQITEGGARR